MTFAGIPSPDHGVWHLGPLPIRAYALCIIAGVVVAVWLGEKRWVARGGKPGQVGDIALWAVPFGLVGGRLYHVATDWRLYFGEGKDPVAALYVWQGGLGIWGAIGLGALGAYLGARRYGAKFPPLIDALAPGVVLAQAIGRFGNWFNQELYGRPTTLPWGLEIDPAHREEGYEQYATFHPTFLYESLWNVGTAVLVIWADKKFRLGHGRAFALYVMAYTAGRAWIEALRIDKVQENDVFGLRLNVWTSIVVFLAALVFFVVSARRHPGREEQVLREGFQTDEPEESDESDGPAEAEQGDVPAGDTVAEPGNEPSKERGSD